MKPVVYTAGPIAGCTWDDTIDWRVYVAKLMGPAVDVRSPMRGKEFLEGQAAMPLTAGDGHPIAAQHAIVIRDHHDVAQSAVIIANLLPSVEINKASIGTAFELAWAYEFKIPVVVVMKEPNPNWHPFILEAAYVVVPDLNEAIVLALQVLNLEV